MASIVILACAVLSVFSGIVAQNGEYNPITQHVYHLFTRQNPTISQPMVYASSIGSNYNNQRRTVILLHGYDSGPLAPFNVALVPAILQAADVNVITVDWSAGSNESDYNVLVNDNVPRAAYGIGTFIIWFNLWTESYLNQYNIIGFEVGSHLAGLLGRQFNGLFPFVTALNPPRQGWTEENMIRPTDAVVTEAIHSDIFGTGMLEAVADVDFYPNGGLAQPGCATLDWECSRDRAFLFFAESLITGGFTGIKCDTTEEVVTGDCTSTDTLPMGGLTNKAGQSGLYYVPVNAVPPYSLG